MGDTYATLVEELRQALNKLSDNDAVRQSPW